MSDVDTIDPVTVDAVDPIVVRNVDPIVVDSVDVCRDIHDLADLPTFAISITACNDLYFFDSISSIRAC